jgi:hypothetical protein
MSNITKSDAGLAARKNGRMLRGGLIGLIVMMLLKGAAAAQTVAPPASGNIIPTPYDMSRRHMSPTGKPCLSFSSSAKAQTLNKNIYEHWVGAANSCGQHIKVRVCYYKTQDCMTMDVPPFGRKDSVLGIYPALQNFRYEAKEQFLDAQ